MNEHLANYFRERRLRQGLTLHALARLVAPQNIRKAMGRIGCFESTGIVGDELLATVAEALGIDLPTVEELMALDRQTRPGDEDSHPASTPHCRKDGAGSGQVTMGGRNRDD